MIQTYFYIAEQQQHKISWELVNYARNIKKETKYMNDIKMYFTDLHILTTDKKITQFSIHLYNIF